MTKRVRRGPMAILASAVILCAGWLVLRAQTKPASPPPPGSAAHGRQIYETIGCASCHALSTAQELKDGLLRSGHPLEGAAYRGTWWQGRVATDAGDASEHCLKTFLSPESGGFGADERKALVVFMQGLGDAGGTGPLVMLRRDAGDVDLSAGDRGRGKAVFDSACLTCHLGSPGDLRQLAGRLSPAEIATVVRRGVKTMPFFQVDRLKAGEVADVAAFLEAARDQAPR